MTDAEVDASARSWYESLYNDYADGCGGCPKCSRWHALRHDRKASRRRRMARKRRRGWV